MLKMNSVSDCGFISWLGGLCQKINSLCYEVDDITIQRLPLFDDDDDNREKKTFNSFRSSNESIRPYDSFSSSNESIESFGSFRSSNESTEDESEDETVLEEINQRGIHYGTINGGDFSHLSKSAQDVLRKFFEMM